jgi:ribonuclease PH
MREDGRSNDQLRPVEVIRDFTQAPAGSVLWQQGNTVVLCTAAISPELPPWFKDDRAGGWVTAEYVMLPASTPQRNPWPKIGHTDSRGTEIQRLIGRALRAAIDLTRIGPHTIALDCQVLQADGGTRTASICGAYVALADAVRKLPAKIPSPPRPISGALPPRYDPAFYDPSKAIVDPVSAVSVGIVDGEIRLDLAYDDDSRASVDMNIAYTAGGKFVEIQGSAENGEGFGHPQLLELVEMATRGCREIAGLQASALATEPDTLGEVR